MATCMPDNPDTSELVARFRTGDSTAADVLFERYTVRLTALARARMSRKLAARIDPEDIMMSAYRSFFIGAREGRFSFSEGGELWRLLVTITLRKLYRQAAKHTAARRDFSLERQVVDSGQLTQFISRDPTPEEVVAVSDLLETLMSNLNHDERRVLELRLQGEQTSEVARAIGKSQRTVRRCLERIRTEMRQLRGWTDVPVPRPEPDRAPGFPSRVAGTFGSRRSRAIGILPTEAPLRYSDYILERMIGCGGIGKVYQACERSTRTPVAVKFLRKRLLTNDEAVSGFVREERIVRRLEHSRIVTVHGLGRTPWGGIFIVMDLIEGSDLAKQLANGPVPLNLAIDWMLAVAEAVAFAHEHGVLHCDLKPGNVLLSSVGIAFLTDFGLARMADDQQQPIQFAGTAAYMAPEQVSDCWGLVSEATDVYGLSAMLYHLIAGQPPYLGTRTADVLAQLVSSHRPRPPCEINQSIPAELNKLCLDGLEKSIDRRTPRASEWMTRLGAIRKGAGPAPLCPQDRQEFE